MTPQQILALAAALAHAQAADRVFSTHSAAVPPELVFARYYAEQALWHLNELFGALPARDRRHVGRQLARLRSAAAGQAFSTNVVPLNAQSTPAPPPHSGDMPT